MSNVEGEAVSRRAHLPRPCKSLGGSSPLHPPCMRLAIGRTGSLSQNRVSECAGNDDRRQREAHLSRTVSKNSPPEEKIRVNVSGFAFSDVFEGFALYVVFFRGVSRGYLVFCETGFCSIIWCFSEGVLGVIRCFFGRGKYDGAGMFATASRHGRTRGYGARTSLRRARRRRCL